MRNSLLILAAALAPATLAPGAAAARDISVSTASSVSSGRYGGTAATRVASTSLGLRTGLSGWQVSATLPYLSIESAGDVAILNGLFVSPTAGRRRQTGYGDVQLRVERAIPSGRIPLDARFSGHMKMPTGARSLSSGKVDTGMAVELSRTLGRFTPYVATGYRMYGDDASRRLSNGWTAAAGATYSHRALTFSASYERSDAPYGGTAPRELFGVANFGMGSGWNWSLYGSKGLNAGSANLMVGTALTRQVF